MPCARVTPGLQAFVVFVRLLGSFGMQQRSNGKTFQSTGAWTISKEYVAKNRCNNGRIREPDELEVECAYKLDKRLASCLGHFFRGLSVSELGAGVGRYKRHVDASGLAGPYVAYDGLTNVTLMTRGRVQFADLTVDNPFIRRSDFALSLEVAEHIPPKYEKVLLRNYDRANRQGIVLSWSNLGSSQSNHGHVNPKRKSMVRLLFSKYGYSEDRNASAYLRQCATFLYLKRGIQVFRRTTNISLPQAPYPYGYGL